MHVYVFINKLKMVTIYVLHKHHSQSPVDRQKIFQRAYLCILFNRLFEDAYLYLDLVLQVVLISFFLSFHLSLFIYFANVDTKLNAPKIYDLTVIKHLNHILNQTAIYK